jgi:hypothetical protein
VVAKVISRRIKSILSNKVSKEQFGFLEGRQIHMGTDLWPGSGENRSLSRNMIHHLNSGGFFYLNQIVDPDCTTICGHAWKIFNQVGLEEVYSFQWDNYIRELKVAHV